MSIFARTPHSLKSYNGLPWKPWNFITKAHLFLSTISFLHLSGPIEPYADNEMSYVFKVGLFSPLDTSLPDVFPSFLSFN